MPILNLQEETKYYNAIHYLGYSVIQLMSKNLRDSKKMLKELVPFL